VNLNPDFASQLATRNAWLDLNAKVPADLRSTYLQWKASTLNGKSFGIPWYLTTRVTIYNTDLLNQAVSLSLRLMQNWRLMLGN